VPHTRRVKLVFPTSQVGECGSLRGCSEEGLLETRWNRLVLSPLRTIEDNFSQSTNTYSSCLHFLIQPWGRQEGPGMLSGYLPFTSQSTLSPVQSGKEPRTDLRIRRA
jgi:hypothetical protein